jgi:hypothetical protein
MMKTTPQPPNGNCGALYRGLFDPLYHADKNLFFVARPWLLWLWQPRRIAPATPGLA